MECVARLHSKLAVCGSGGSSDGLSSSDRALQGCGGLRGLIVDSGRACRDMPWI